MGKPRTLRKSKRTFSLSGKALSYLESVRRERKRQSMSAALEDIIREQQEAKEMERISASISSYYDSLTDKEREENRAWGEFAETQFPTED